MNIMTSFLPLLFFCPSRLTDPLTLILRRLIIPLAVLKNVLESLNFLPQGDLAVIQDRQMPRSLLHEELDDARGFSLRTVHLSA